MAAAAARVADSGAAILALTLLRPVRASGFELTTVGGDNEAFKMGKRSPSAPGQYQSLIDRRRQGGASSNDAWQTER